MYCLNEQQVDYILSDIRRRGVEMEDLQLNLLDHICCIVEQNLKEGEDFEAFYKKTIPKFFTRELWEIEEETITLLTFKHYYAMKKIMMTTGAISVAALLFGSLFKVMHWPGAGPMLVLGIATLSLIFLPLLFILKARESHSAREKVVGATGTVVGILLCMATLFKIMHWPGASLLWLLTSVSSIFLFIPLYFFTGIRKPETKLNTVITTIILVGATGLLFSLTSVRKSRQLTLFETYAYLHNEQLLQRLNSLQKNEPEPLAAKINSTCNKIKEKILMHEIGKPILPANFEAEHIVIYEGQMSEEFQHGGEGTRLIQDLKKLVDQYNSTHPAETEKIPVGNTVFDTPPGESIAYYSNLAALNDLVRVQMFLASSRSSITGK